MTIMDPTSAEFFEFKYQRQPDPWAFASSKYELDRYEKICKIIQGQRYQQAFEPGCSIGILTQRLATFCDRVEAMDISVRAVQFAQERCSDLENVHIHSGSLPDCLPQAAPDLLILSEIGYYMSEDTWRKTVTMLLEQCIKPTTVVAAHWLGHSVDHVLTGDHVHEVLDAIDGLRLITRQRYEGFRLDRWSWL